ncbi:unnamed protein product [Urochloa humidicola]
MAPPSNPNAKRMKMTTTAGSSCSNTDDDARLPPDSRRIITDLPRCILGTILTLLTIRDAARTAAASREWNHVFNSPDCRADTIDDSDLWHGPRRPRSRSEWFKQREWRSGAITSTLSYYGGAIRRFVIRQTSLTVWWLRKLSDRGDLQELVLHMPSPPPLPLPHFVFDCGSLRSLSLANFTWPAGTTTSNSLEWTLPHLVELTLIRMDMAAGEVEVLLRRRCPALLSLVVSYPRRAGRMRVQSETLRSVTFVGQLGGTNSYCVWITASNAPNLRRLLWWPPAPFCVRYGPDTWGMPRLDTLGVFHRHAISPVEVTIWNVRTIALTTNMDSCKEVQEAIHMLHKLPMLEILHLQLDNGSKSRNQKATNFEEMADGPIPCLEKSLKTIVLRVPNLIHQKLAFANFLLGAAKVLKSMLICNKRMAGELLRPESRGSPNAQVVFLKNSKCTLDLDMSASNYKLADPFMP